MAYLRPTIKNAENRQNAPSGLATPQMYEITNLVIKKLNARYRDTDPRDISRLIDALLDDIIMYEQQIKEKNQKIGILEQKYEDFKAIKINSASPVLFPHQKQKQTRLSMQSQKVKYLEELLKRDELAIANAKDRIAQLESELRYERTKEIL